MSETVAESLGGVVEKDKPSEPILFVEDFYPFDVNRVNNFCCKIDHELLIATLSPHLSGPQVHFVNKTVVATSRLVEYELTNHNLVLPDLYARRVGAGMLPGLVRKLQSESGNRGLQEVCTRYNGRLLSTPGSWKEIAHQMAMGEIVIAPDTEHLRKPLEDYAASMLDFIWLFAEKNDGLNTDDMINKQISNILGSYNYVHHPDMLREAEQEAIKSERFERIVRGMGRTSNGRFFQFSQVE